MKRLLVVGLVAGAGLLAACGRAVEAKGDVSQGPAPADAVEITMTDNEFTPARVHAAAGEEITLELTNNDDTPHNLVIEELDLSTGTIDSGEVATATLTMPDSEVEFVCTFHGGMKGTLVPEEA